MPASLALPLCRLIPLLLAAMLLTAVRPGFAGAQAGETETTARQSPLGPEIVEADVSSRAIAVKSDFTGKEIIVFGSIHNSRQQSASEGYYDVVIVVEGAPMPLILRRKGNVAGVWMNTSSTQFDRVPSFYALSSTQPLRAIASAEVFADQGIGFSHIRITPRHPVKAEELAEQRAAIIRLKKKEKIYVQKQTGVTFIGRSLFRSSVMLPANVPVGMLNARVYLFHNGAMISNYTATLQLEREGLERWLHDLAHKNGFLYGLLAIITAMAAGFAASEISRRRMG